MNLIESSEEELEWAEEVVKKGSQYVYICQIENPRNH